jgi:glycosyltransferase involved in cell wall biosynthesis
MLRDARLSIEQDARPVRMSDKSMPRLSVVVPCFNEEAGLPELYRRLTAACGAVADTRYEIVLVNDGSSDSTLRVMRMLSSKDSHVITVNLSRNYGHQLALTAGLRLASGERVLIIDADLQDPPELLSEMMALVDAGADVVYGQRRHREAESPFKLASAKIFYRLLRRLTDVDIPRDTGDFRLMTHRAVQFFNDMPEQHRFVRGMISWIGLAQVPLLYDREPRFAGTTKYPLIKMVRFAVDAITGFSMMPLRAASILGLIMGLISMVMVAYTLGSWFFGRTVEGWTSLTTIFLVLSSAQLLFLGVLGEYLGRLYMQAKQRPLYIVESIYRVAEPHNG